MTAFWIGATIGLLITILAGLWSMAEDIRFLQRSVWDTQDAIRKLREDLCKK